MITRSQTRRQNEVNLVCDNKENKNLVRNAPPKKPARKVTTRQLKQNKKMNAVICDLYTKNTGKKAEINKPLDKNTHGDERESDVEVLWKNETSDSEIDEINRHKTWKPTVKLDGADGNSCTALGKNVSELSFHNTKENENVIKVRTVPSAVSSSTACGKNVSSELSFHNTKENENVKVRTVPSAVVSSKKEVEVNEGRASIGNLLIVKKRSTGNVSEEPTSNDEKDKNTTLLANLFTVDTVGHKGRDHEILEESSASDNGLDENQKVETAVGQIDNLFKVDTSGRHHDNSDDDDDDSDEDDMEEDDTNALPAPKLLVESRLTFKSYGSKKKDDFDLDDTYLDISLNDKRGMNINKEARRFCKVDEVLKKSVITSGFEKLESVPSYQESERILQKKRKKERERTKGSNWFNMPAKELTDEVKNDLEVLQMRSVLDPKHFYKKNDLKVLPKYFQVGKVVESAADFYHSRIPKKQRKRTMVEELLADSEFKKYNKKRYKEIIQERRKSHYKAHVHAKKLKHKK